MKKNLFIKNNLLVVQKLKNFENLILTKSFSQNFGLDLLDHRRRLLSFYLVSKAWKQQKLVSSITSQCFLTWRSGSTYSFFRLTRLTLREKFSFGEIKGLRKSSW